MDLQLYFAYLVSFLSVGSFVIIDLIAATTNALNGALLAQRPDYYRGRQWTVVGIIILAIFGGIGGDRRAGSHCVAVRRGHHAVKAVRQRDEHRV